MIFLWQLTSMSGYRTCKNYPFDSWPRFHDAGHVRVISLYIVSLWVFFLLKVLLHLSLWITQYYFYCLQKLSYKTLKLLRVFVLHFSNILCSVLARGNWRGAQPCPKSPLSLCSFNYSYFLLYNFNVFSCIYF
jgi:hypothetical protein